MDLTSDEKLVTTSKKEYQRRQSADQEVKNIFYRKAVFGGLAAGLLVSIFLAFGGFYITGDHAGIGFAKYLFLAVILGVILYQLKIASATGRTFKRGIVIGMLTSVVAAITTAVGALIVNSTDSINAMTLYPYFGEASSELLSSFVLSGITFFEGIVAGLILTFIWLQIFKDRSRAK